MKQGDKDDAVAWLNTMIALSEGTETFYGCTINGVLSFLRVAIMEGNDAELYLLLKHIEARGRWNAARTSGMVNN
jgi:hypothetical protein